MQLDFSPEQERLRDSVRSVLERECPMSLVREVVENGTGADALWAQMLALGWPALTVSETLGGVGKGLLELAVVVEELGRVMAPGPFLPTVTQFLPAVREAGSAAQAERFLAAVARGELTGTLAVSEESTSYDPASVAATATPEGDDYVLAGTKDVVVEAAGVDELVVVARVPATTGDDGVGAFVVPRDSVVVEPIATLDPSRPLARVVLDGARVTADRVLDVPGPNTTAALRRAGEEATTALALETVGTCQAIFDVTLDYAKHREQFGVPIGSFQAIKHKFADMLVLLERARSTCYFAALTIAEDDDRRSLAVSSAKAAAGDCARRLAKEGIQIHGGIGYTWEHDMHLYVRRVRSSALLFGTTADHYAGVAQLIGL